MTRLLRGAQRMTGSLNPVQTPGSNARHRALAVAVALLLVSGVVGAFLVEPPAVASRAVAAAPPPTTTTTIPPTPVFVPEPEPAPAPLPKQPAKPVNANGEGLEPIVKIGTIEIPKIGLRHDIYHGITMRNINLGPSHWPGTAFPGEPGNAVFPGHRTTKTRPFRNIDKLVPGDEVIFTVNGVRSVYRVNGSRIVTPKQIEIINPTPTPTATIFACHPPGSARFRYVVTMDLVTS